jgi:1,4-alpha-glucan branching enzyme
MVKLTKEGKMFSQRMGDLRLMKAPEQTVVFSRNGMLFAFNFHASNSLTNVLVPVPNEAEYTVELCTDDEKYGGWNQVAHQTYPTKAFDGQNYVELYLPARTAVVLKEKKIKKAAPKKPAAKKTAAKKPAAKKTK